MSKLPPALKKLALPVIDRRRRAAEHRPVHLQRQPEHGLLRPRGGDARCLGPAGRRGRPGRHHQHRAQEAAGRAALRGAAVHRQLEQLPDHGGCHGAAGPRWPGARPGRAVLPGHGPVRGHQAHARSPVLRRGRGGPDARHPADRGHEPRQDRSLPARATARPPHWPRRSSPRMPSCSASSAASMAPTAPTTATRPAWSGSGRSSTCSSTPSPS